MGGFVLLAFSLPTLTSKSATLGWATRRQRDATTRPLRKSRKERGTLLKLCPAAFFAGLWRLRYGVH